MRGRPSLGIPPVASGLDPILVLLAFSDEPMNSLSMP
jgi:hypothetical protein